MQSFLIKVNALRNMFAEKGRYVIGDERAKSDNPGNWQGREATFRF
jgi:hypothetical protein